MSSQRVPNKMVLLFGYGLSVSRKGSCAGSLAPSVVVLQDSGILYVLLSLTGYEYGLYLPNSTNYKTFTTISDLFKMWTVIFEKRKRKNMT